VLGLLLTLLTSAVAGTASAKSAVIKVLVVEGDIVPAVADYINQGITEAENDGSVAVVIELSTPGGLYTTTQDIVRRILESKVPVVVYVPTGSWAASAGTFITLASHVAAMAPGSRMGAAHPVSVGQDIPEDSKQKITEDAAAWIRSIATLRGRDAEQAELAVTESRSFTDGEALEKKLIDLRVRDMDDLLAQLDGRTVKLASGEELVLSTRGASTETKDMNLLQKLLQVIANANVAYILMSVGSIGLIVEISNPGLIFPGVVGGICLLMAFYGLGVLNAYWGGVLLVLLAIILFVLELFVTSHGILTGGAVAALTVGSLILFSGTTPEIEVSRGLIAAVVIIFTAMFVFIVGAVVRGQRRRPAVGKDVLVGKTAKVISPLEPTGTVLVEGERWLAEVDSGVVEAAEEVVIKSVEGLKLYVARRVPAGEPEKEKGGS